MQSRDRTCEVSRNDFFKLSEQIRVLSCISGVSEESETCYAQETFKNFFSKKLFFVATNNCFLVLIIFAVYLTY